MILGILSDSHGDAPMTARAVRFLIDRGAEKLIHCGDICGERVLDELAGHDCCFVWGNCDAPSPVLKKYVAALGLPWPNGPLRMNCAGKRIAVFHGHEADFCVAVETGGFDYVFHGHTHRCADDRVDGCRVVNPGALHRAAVKTVALVDVVKDWVRFLELETGEEI